MVTTPWSENFPLQGIKFPRGGSSGVENSLNNPGWETWVYELGPLRGQAHSFHSSGWGEISRPLHGTEGPSWWGAPEEARREGILNLEAILCPGQRRAMRSSRTRSWQTLSRTLGSRAIGGNVYRQSLGHVCIIASGLGGAGCVSENQSGQWDVSRDINRSTRASISAPPPWGGASIPRASAWRNMGGCLLLYCGPLGCKLLKETTSFGTTGGFGSPVCKVDVTANPPGDLSRRPPTCCLSGQAHGGPWDLLGHSWEQEIQPTSPDGWCAMRDAGPSTAPQPVREASVVSILRRHEAPSTGPWDRNQGFFHITKARKHRRVTLIIRKGLPLKGKPFGPEPLL